RLTDVPPNTPKGADDTIPYRRPSGSFEEGSPMKRDRQPDWFTRLLLESIRDGKNPGMHLCENCGDVALINDDHKYCDKCAAPVNRHPHCNSRVIILSNREAAEYLANSLARIGWEVEFYPVRFIDLDENRDMPAWGVRINKTAREKWGGANA